MKHKRNSAMTNRKINVMGVLMSTIFIAGCQVVATPIEREYGFSQGIVSKMEELPSMGEYSCDIINKYGEKRLFYNEYYAGYKMVIQDINSTDNDRRVELYVKEFTYESYKVGDVFTLDQGIPTERPYTTRPTTEDEKRTQKDFCSY